MSIEISGDLAKFLQVLTGEEFPQADEDNLFAQSRALHKAADDVTESADQFVAGVNAYRNGADGQTGDTFVEDMRRYVMDDPGYIGITAKYVNRLGHSYRNTATELQYAKLMVIAALIELLLEFLVAIAMAWINPGAALATLLRGRLLMQLLERSLVARLIARVVAAQLVGIGLQTAMDVLVQAYQFSQGSRDQWNKEATISAVEIGSLGGVVGLGIGGGLTGVGKLLGKLGSHIPTPKVLDNIHLNDATKNFLTHTAPAAAHEITTEATSEIMTEGLYNAMKGQGFKVNALYAGLSGGISGVAGVAGSGIGARLNKEFGPNWSERLGNGPAEVAQDEEPLLGSGDDATPDTDSVASEESDDGEPDNRRRGAEETGSGSAPAAGAVGAGIAALNGTGNISAAGTPGNAANSTNAATGTNAATSTRGATSTNVATSTNASNTTASNTSAGGNPSNAGGQGSATDRSGRPTTAGATSTGNTASATAPASGSSSVSAAAGPVELSAAAGPVEVSAESSYDLNAAAGTDTTAAAAGPATVDSPAIDSSTSDNGTTAVDSAAPERAFATAEQPQSAATASWATPAAAPVVSVAQVAPKVAHAMSGLPATRSADPLVDCAIRVGDVLGRLGAHTTLDDRAMVRPVDVVEQRLDGRFAPVTEQSLRESLAEGNVAALLLEPAGLDKHMLLVTKVNGQLMTIETQAEPDRAARPFRETAPMKAVLSGSELRQVDPAEAGVVGRPVETRSAGLLNALLDPPTSISPHGKRKTEAAAEEQTTSDIEDWAILEPGQVAGLPSEPARSGPGSKLRKPRPENAVLKASAARSALAALALPGLDAGRPAAATAGAVTATPGPVQQNLLVTSVRAAADAQRLSALFGRLRGEGFIANSASAYTKVAFSQMALNAARHQLQTHMHELARLAPESPDLPRVLDETALAVEAVKAAAEQSGQQVRQTLEHRTVKAYQHSRPDAVRDLVSKYGGQVAGLVELFEISNVPVAGAVQFTFTAAQAAFLEGRAHIRVAALEKDFSPLQAVAELDKKPLMMANYVVERQKALVHLALDAASIGGGMVPAWGVVKTALTKITDKYLDERVKITEDWLAGHERPGDAAGRLREAGRRVWDDLRETLKDKLTSSEFRTLLSDAAKEGNVEPLKAAEFATDTVLDATLGAIFRLADIEGAAVVDGADMRGWIRRVTGHGTPAAHETEAETPTTPVHARPPEGFRKVSANGFPIVTVDPAKRNGGRDWVGADFHGVLVWGWLGSNDHFTPIEPGDHLVEGARWLDRTVGREEFHAMAEDTTVSGRWYQPFADSFTFLFVADDGRAFWAPGHAATGGLVSDEHDVQHELIAHPTWLRTSFNWTAPARLEADFSTLDTAKPQIDALELQLFGAEFARRLLDTPGNGPIRLHIKGVSRNALRPENAGKRAQALRDLLVERVVHEYGKARLIRGKEPVELDPDRIVVIEEGDAAVAPPSRRTGRTTRAARAFAWIDGAAVEPVQAPATEPPVSLSVPNRLIGAMGDLAAIDPNNTDPLTDCAVRVDRVLARLGGTAATLEDGATRPVDRVRRRMGGTFQPATVADLRTALLPGHATPVLLEPINGVRHMVLVVNTDEGLVVVETQATGRDRYEMLTDEGLGSIRLVVDEDNRLRQVRTAESKRGMVSGGEIAKGGETARALIDPPRSTGPQGRRKTNAAPPEQTTSDLEDWAMVEPDQVANPPAGLARNGNGGKLRKAMPERAENGVLKASTARAALAALAMPGLEVGRPAGAPARILEPGSVQQLMLVTAVRAAADAQRLSALFGRLRAEGFIANSVPAFTTVVFSRMALDAARRVLQGQMSELAGLAPDSPDLDRVLDETRQAIGAVKNAAETAGHRVRMTLEHRAVKAYQHSRPDAVRELVDKYGGKVTALVELLEISNAPVAGAVQFTFTAAQAAFLEGKARWEVRGIEQEHSAMQAVAALDSKPLMMAEYVVARQKLLVHLALDAASIGGSMLPVWGVVKTALTKLTDKYLDERVKITEDWLAGRERPADVRGRLQEAGRRVWDDLRETLKDKLTGSDLRDLLTEVAKEGKVEPAKAAEFATDTVLDAVLGAIFRLADIDGAAVVDGADMRGWIRRVTGHETPAAHETEAETPTTPVHTRPPEGFRKVSANGFPITAIDPAKQSGDRHWVGADFHGVLVWGWLSGDQFTPVQPGDHLVEGARWLDRTVGREEFHAMAEDTTIGGRWYQPFADSFTFLFVSDDGRAFWAPGHAATGGLVSDEHDVQHELIAHPTWLRTSFNWSAPARLEADFGILNSDTPRIDALELQLFGTAFAQHLADNPDTTAKVRIKGVSRNALHPENAGLRAEALRDILVERIRHEHGKAQLIRDQDHGEFDPDKHVVIEQDAAAAPASRRTGRLTREARAFAWIDGVAAPAVPVTTPAVDSHVPNRLIGAMGNLPKIDPKVTDPLTDCADRVDQVVSELGGTSRTLEEGTPAQERLQQRMGGRFAAATVAELEATLRRDHATPVLLAPINGVRHLVLVVKTAAGLVVAETQAAGRDRYDFLATDESGFLDTENFASIQVIVDGDNHLRQVRAGDGRRGFLSGGEIKPAGDTARGMIDPPRSTEAQGWLLQKKAPSTSGPDHAVHTYQVSALATAALVAGIPTAALGLRPNGPAAAIALDSHAEPDDGEMMAAIIRKVTEGQHQSTSLNQILETEFIRNSAVATYRIWSARHDVDLAVLQLENALRDYRRGGRTDVLTAEVIDMASRLAARLEQTGRSVRAVLENKSVEGHVSLQKSGVVDGITAVSQGVNTGLGFLSLGAGPIPAAASFGVSVAREVAISSFAAFREHHFRSEHSVLAAVETLDAKPYVLAEHAIEQQRRAFTLLLEAASIGASMLPGWEFAKIALESTAEAYLDARLRTKLIKRIEAQPGDTAAIRAARIEAAKKQLWKDFGAQVKEKVSSLEFYQKLSEGDPMEAGQIAEEVGLKSVLGAIFELLGVDPMEKVTGADMHRWIRAVTGHNPEMPPSPITPATPVHAPAPDRFDKVDAAGRPIVTAEAGNGVVAVNFHGVLISGSFDPVTKAFTPSDPLDHDHAMTKWRKRILHRDGYTMVGAKGAEMVRGRWYRPWPAKQTYLFVGDDGKAAWAPAFAPTGGTNSDEYNIATELGRHSDWVHQGFDWTAPDTLDVDFNRSATTGPQVGPLEFQQFVAEAARRIVDAPNGVPTVRVQVSGRSTLGLDSERAGRRAEAVREKVVERLRAEVADAALVRGVPAPTVDPADYVSIVADTTQNTVGDLTARARATVRFAEVAAPAPETVVPQAVHDALAETDRFPGPRRMSDDPLVDCAVRVGHALGKLGAVRRGAVDDGAGSRPIDTIAERFRGEFTRADLRSLRTSLRPGHATAVVLDAPRQARHAVLVVRVGDALVLVETQSGPGRPRFEYLADDDPRFAFMQAPADAEGRLLQAADRRVVTSAEPMPAAGASDTVLAQLDPPATVSPHGPTPGNEPVRADSWEQVDAPPAEDLDPRLIENGRTHPNVLHKQGPRAIKMLMGNSIRAALAPLDAPVPDLHSSLTPLAEAVLASPLDKGFDHATMVSEALKVAGNARRLGAVLDQLRGEDFVSSAPVAWTQIFAAGLRIDRAVAAIDQDLIAFARLAPDSENGLAIASELMSSIEWVSRTAARTGEAASRALKTRVAEAVLHAQPDGVRTLIEEHGGKLAEITALFEIAGGPVAGAVSFGFSALQAGLLEALAAARLHSFTENHSALEAVARLKPADMAEYVTAREKLAVKMALDAVSIGGGMLPGWGIVKTAIGKVADKYLDEKLQHTKDLLEGKHRDTDLRGAMARVWADTKETLKEKVTSAELKSALAEIAKEGPDPLKLGELATDTVLDAVLGGVFQWLEVSALSVLTSDDVHDWLNRIGGLPATETIEAAPETPTHPRPAGGFPLTDRNGFSIVTVNESRSGGGRHRVGIDFHGSLVWGDLTDGTFTPDEPGDHHVEKFRWHGRTLGRDQFREMVDKDAVTGRLYQPWPNRLDYLFVTDDGRSLWAPGSSQTGGSRGVQHDIHHEVTAHPNWLGKSFAWTAPDRLDVDFDTTDATTPKVDPLQMQQFAFEAARRIVDEDPVTVYIEGHSSNAFRPENARQRAEAVRDQLAARIDHEVGKAQFLRGLDRTVDNHASIIEIVEDGQTTETPKPLAVRRGMLTREPRAVAWMSAPASTRTPEIAPAVTEPEPEAVIELVSPRVREAMDQLAPVRAEEQDALTDCVIRVNELLGHLGGTAVTLDDGAAVKGTGRIAQRLGGTFQDATVAGVRAALAEGNLAVLLIETAGEARHVLPVLMTAKGLVRLETQAVPEHRYEFLGDDDLPMIKVVLDQDRRLLQVRADGGRGVVAGAVVPEAAARTARALVDAAATTEAQGGGSNRLRKLNRPPLQPPGDTVRRPQGFALMAALKTAGVAVPGLVPAASGATAEIALGPDHADTPLMVGVIRKVGDGRRQSAILAQLSDAEFVRTSAVATYEIWSARRDVDTAVKQLEGVLEQYVAADHAETMTPQVINQTSRLAKEIDDAGHDVKAMLEHKSVVAHIEQQPSRARNTIKTVSERLNSVLGLLSLGAGPIPAAASFGVSVARETALAALATFREHDFRSERSVLSAMETLDRNPYALAEHVIAQQKRGFKLLLDAASIGGSMTPAWDFVKIALSATSEVYLDERLRTKLAAELAADPSVSTVARVKARIWKDFETQIREKMASGDLVKLMADAAAGKGFDPLTAGQMIEEIGVRSLLGGFFELMGVDPVEPVTGADMHRWIRTVTGHSAEVPPSPVSPIAPEHPPLPANFDRVDGAGRPIVTVKPGTSTVGVDFHGVLVEGAFDRSSKNFTPARPAEHGLALTKWRKRILQRDGYTEQGGGVVKGRWYQPFPGQKTFLFVGEDGAATWAPAFATTGGVNNGEYNVRAELEAHPKWVHPDFTWTATDTLADPADPLAFQLFAAEVARRIVDAPHGLPVTKVQVGGRDAAAVRERLVERVGAEVRKAAWARGRSDLTVDAATLIEAGHGAETRIVEGVTPAPGTVVSAELQAAVATLDRMPAISSDPLVDCVIRVNRVLGELGGVGRTTDDSAGSRPIDTIADRLGGDFTRAGLAGLRAALQPGNATVVVLDPPDRPRHAVIVARSGNALVLIETQGGPRYSYLSSDDPRFAIMRAATDGDGHLRQFRTDGTRRVVSSPAPLSGTSAASDRVLALTDPPTSTDPWGGGGNKIHKEPTGPVRGALDTLLRNTLATVTPGATAPMQVLRPSNRSAALALASEPGPDDHLLIGLFRSIAQGRRVRKVLDHLIHQEFVWQEPVVAMTVNNSRRAIGIALLAVDRAAGDLQRDPAASPAPLIEAVEALSRTVKDAGKSARVAIENTAVRAHIHTQPDAVRDFVKDHADKINTVVGAFDVGGSFVPGLISLGVSVGRETVVESLAMWHRHVFRAGNSALVAVDTLDEKPLALAQYVANKQRIGLGLLLDAASVGAGLLPGWEIAKLVITKVSEGVLAERLRQAEQQVAVVDADTSTDQQTRLQHALQTVWGDTHKALQDKLTSGEFAEMAKTIAEEGQLDGLKTAKLVTDGVLSSLLGGFLELMPIDPAEVVTGDDMRGWIRGAAGHAGPAVEPPSPVTPVHPALPQGFAAADRNGHRIITKEGDLVGIDFHGVLVWGDLSNTQDFRPARPGDHAYEQKAWSRRALAEDGYLENGAKVTGRWYQPWADVFTYLFVDDDGTATWAAGTATTGKLHSATHDVHHEVPGWVRPFSWDPPASLDVTVDGGTPRLDPLRFQQLAFDTAQKIVRGEPVTVNVEAGTGATATRDQIVERLEREVRRALFDLGSDREIDVAEHVVIVTGDDTLWQRLTGSGLSVWTSTPPPAATREGNGSWALGGGPAR
ncbi:hypothetical protein [Actinoplanes sp. NPDC026619]|uniref:WXG100-like domain-containing protein n=1 Tax=Actinoplanes sp. NPDC026619 TaxID=3155798 RepID=UPI0033C08B97